ncbi:hypothetical protein WJ63_01560 [Burkholderia pyrrocinia]|nr:hypothetical protein WJ63_01560 [Burkholderia pyrrocinia]
MSATEAVRAGLMISITDRTEMLKDASYYRAQLTMLDAEATHYCDTIDKFATVPQAELFAEAAAVHTLHRALIDIMRSAIPLLESAAACVTGVPTYFAAWSRKVETPFEVFKGTEQIIYGTYSGMTHADRAPHIPVAVLRTAIELRLRYAFGISGYVNASRPDERIPIDLSKLFEAIQNRQRDIEFAVDIHDVWKIYRWSNFYLHAGVREYPWVAGFLLKYLFPLFYDIRAEPNGNWNSNGGIRMKRETWHAVRSVLEPEAERSNFALRLRNAWRALFPGPKRTLSLAPFTEDQAQCMFENK